MTTRYYSSVDETSESIAIQHEFVIDAEARKRLTRAMTLFALARPSAVILFATLVILSLGLLFSGILGTENSGLAALFVFFVLLLTPFTAYFSVWRRLKKWVPLGSRYAVGLGDTGMRVESPVASAVMSYGAYRRVLVRKGIVIFRQHMGNSYSALPIELFPGDDVDRLRSAVARANP
jgi:hypothetical protein